MAAAVARMSPLPDRAATPPPQLSLNTSTRGTPAAVPNKHLPICSPGPRPVESPQTPPATPPDNQTVETTSLLHPPETFKRLVNDPPVFSITAQETVDALNHIATQPLPDPKLVFPWLHGLHADNQIQLAFFVARRKILRKIPRCLRGITIVKAGGDLTRSRLKGAIAPEEMLVMKTTEDAASFIECDPKDGFSVRNFQIQACKMGTVSDIIVYGADGVPRMEVEKLAKRISRSQNAWREKHYGGGNEGQQFSTFVISDPFSTFEKKHPDLVAMTPKGEMTGNVHDFFYWERREMCEMSEASEISRNVYMGPTPDPSLESASTDPLNYDVMIECTDLAHVPDSRSLKTLRKLVGDSRHPSLQVEFPSSGSIMPPSWSQAEVDGLMEMCKWIYEVANPRKDSVISPLKDVDSDGDSIMENAGPRSRRLLIHCTDGYTETSLLALTYFMYAEGLPVHEAWVRLHRDKGRNFFAYPSDVALLTSIQPRILQESPRWRGSVLSVPDPKWLTKMDGSLPSRVLPYMYLGNLGHANNPDLLKELGITRILSVGEPVSWPREMKETWPADDLLFIDRVQDNGVDPLTEEFEKCLSFIERGKLDGHATLVHCRVGVSRSATICIAEVMNEMGLSFPRAYCFVRARRLNVIIQPHLRFTYELMKWDESQQQKRGELVKRELEWATIAREIACMNRPYSRQN